MAAATAASARKERRSYAVRFDGADGAALMVRASRTREGAARTEVVHSTRDGKKWRHSRGAMEQHATIEAARARQDALAAQAAKLGRKVRESRGGGFARRPGAFDAAHMPAPGKTKKTA